MGAQYTHLWQVQTLRQLFGTQAAWHADDQRKGSLQPSSALHPQGEHSRGFRLSEVSRLRSRQLSACEYLAATLFVYKPVDRPSPVSFETWAIWVL